MPEFHVPDRPWSVGFTGTQKGMTDAQMDTFRDVLIVFRPAIFRHGVCEGADEQAHKIVRQLIPDCKIIGHPGVKKDGKPWKRSYKAEADLDKCLPEKPFLERNEDIVKVDFLIATPKEKKMQQRSGTWSTVRRARWAHTFVILVIYPDGTMEIEYADE